MARRSSRQRRFLGLWTATWLFVLLLAGVLRFGDLRVQWPVLLIPLLWAVVALRPRRGARPAPDPDDELSWHPDADAEPPPRPAFPERRDPGTREQPWLPEVPPAPGHPRQE